MSFRFAVFRKNNANIERNMTGKKDRYKPWKNCSFFGFFIITYCHCCLFWTTRAAQDKRFLKYSDLREKKQDLTCCLEHWYWNFRSNVRAVDDKQSHAISSPCEELILLKSVWVRFNILILTFVEVILCSESKMLGGFNLICYVKFPPCRNRIGDYNIAYVKQWFIVKRKSLRARNVQKIW